MLICLVNKHDKSKEIGEKIYRLTKNYFHIRDIKKLKAEDYRRIQKYREHIKLKPGSMMMIIFYSYHLVTMLKIIIGLIIIGKNKHLKQLKNIQENQLR